MKYVIYIHTNKLNHKSYVGQTCRTEDPNLRWANGKGYSKCRKFYNAIKKYGWDCFEHKILAEVDSTEEADNLERYYIKLYNSINNGYNIASGGAGRRLYKPVYQLDATGVIISRFDSTTDAAIALNLPIYHNHIVDCCQKRQRTAGGYFWCYVDDYETYTPKIKLKVEFVTTKPVYQLARDKTIIATFPNAYFAAKAITSSTTCYSSAIVECCLGKRSAAYGYFWCYVDDYDSYNIKLSYYNKMVLQIDPNTDKPIALFVNLQAAAKHVNGTTSHIGAVCHGHRKTTYNYKWKFVELYEENLYKNILIEV